MTAAKRRHDLKAKTVEGLERFIEQPFTTSHDVPSLQLSG